MAEKIKQGDAFDLGVEVTLAGQPIAIADIAKVEFMIGGYRKMYPDEVTYSQADGKFYIPLTQQETFSWAVGSIFLDIRVQYSGGDVEGIDNPIPITVTDAISEVVI